VQNADGTYNGVIVELPVKSTVESNRDYINVSVVAHALGVIGRITNVAQTTRELYSQVADSLQTLGVTRRDGLDVTPNVDLSFAISEGELQAVGAGIESGNRGENVVAFLAQNPAQFTQILGLTDTPVGALVTQIDPTVYDNGSGVPVSVGVPASKATIKYIYQSILQPGGTFVADGQTVYDTLDDALANERLDADNFVVPDLIRGSSNLLARIAVRSDANSLTDGAKVVFLSGAMFGVRTDSSSSSGTGASDTYLTVNSSITAERNQQKLKLDSSAGDITVTLADNPRDGENKLLWIFDKTNIITLNSENPAFPVQPPPPVGEGNIEGMWTLTSDFLDRYAPTSRNLTKQGSGGMFVPAVINGESVDMFSFGGTSYLESVTPAYQGIAGGSTRAFTMHYLAPAGVPLATEYFTSWGDSGSGGGRWWTVRYDVGQSAFIVDVKNSSRRFPITDPAIASLFDGSAHFLTVNMTTNNARSIVVKVDGVQAVPSFTDDFPNMNTILNAPFRIGASLTGGQINTGYAYDVRLLDRALSDNEQNEIRFDNLQGGVNLSAASENMVFPVVFDAAISQWVLGVGTEALALTNEANIEALTNRVEDLELGVETKVAFEMQRLGTYTIPVGFDQTINYSTVFRYEINGAAFTPIITNGVWTVDVEGWYQISVEGWLDRTDIGYDTDFVILTVARNGQNYTTTNPAATENLLIGEARHLGSPGVSSSMFLNAGDTVEIKTRNIGSTTTWDFTNFTWKAVKVG
jgi:hypothetical protein